MLVQQYLLPYLRVLNMKTLLNFIEKHKEYFKKIARFTIVFVAYILLTKDNFNFVNTLITSIFGMIIPDTK